jgi:hypothetical protein
MNWPILIISYEIYRVEEFVQYQLHWKSAPVFLSYKLYAKVSFAPHFNHYHTHTCTDWDAGPTLIILHYFFEISSLIWSMRGGRANFCSGMQRIHCYQKLRHILAIDCWLTPRWSDLLHIDRINCYKNMNQEFLIDLRLLLMRYLHPIFMIFLMS